MDVVCFGSIVIDHRRRTDASGASPDPLRIVDRAVDLRIGGVPILARALKAMGFEVGLMGCVGRDIAGYGLKAYLAERVGLNVAAVRHVDAPTSSSFIRLAAEQRYIEHTPGASAELTFQEGDAAFIHQYRPALLAVGYAGLLPKLDADGGQGMADLLRAVRRMGVLAALDTHTAPPYAMLEKPVGQADVFICNDEESQGITGLDSATPAERLSWLWSRYPASDGVARRVLGIAMPDGVQLAYGAQGTFTNVWVPNPHFEAFTPTDLTGAGDYFRAGVYGYLVSHRQAFAQADLDLVQLGRAGHDTACEWLRRTC